MTTVEQIYADYRARGGALSFQQFVDPMRGLCVIAVDPEDFSARYLRWDESLDAMGVKKPTPAALKAGFAEDHAAALNPPIERLRSEAKARVIAYADRITARITARYPAAEVASWQTRADEARAVEAGAAEAATPIITGLSLASGQSRADIATTILVKADAYTAVVVAVTLIRQQAEAAIDAATTGAGVDAALAAHKAAAEAKAAELGLA